MPPKLIPTAPTQRDLSEFTGIPLATIRNYCEMGCPGRPGCYSIPAFFTWLTCLGPKRSETARDEAIKARIEQLQANAEAENA